MKSKLLLPILFFVTFSASANWIPLTTGINDNLNDIYFWNDNVGVVAGSKGIYYTSTGGNGAAAWTRFAPTNAGHLALYNRCKFLKMAAMPVQHKVYICGYDSVNMNSIIFDFDVDNQAFVFAHIGGPNSALYDIEYDGNTKVYAVGTSGTVLRYDLSFGIIFPYPAVTTKTLRSIVMDGSSSGFVDIGGENIFIRANVVLDNLQLTSVSLTDIPFTITSLATYTSTIYAVGPSGAFITNTSSPGVMNQLTFYNEGPLHATSIVQSGQGFRYYVTTDHGVFKMYNYALEIQPPSADFALNSILVREANGPAWACGRNGVILKSTNSGGGTIPFMRASVSNRCAEDFINFDITRPNIGSATNCRVTVFDASNTAIGNFSGCALSQSIGLPNLLGDYTLRLIAENESYADTMYYAINLPAAPAINLPVTISDNILCKSEKIMVNVSATQPGWDYVLYKQGSEQPVGSAAGTGGGISFESNDISQTGTYYIRVSQQSGGCKKNFTDVLPITVEHTKSRLVSQYINAFQGEQVQFHAVSNDAQFYKWTFDNSASQTIVNARTAQVSFNSSGEKFAELQSWTSNGCYDTSVLKLTRIVNEAGLPDDCISLNVPGQLAQFNGGEIPLLRDMQVQSDGLLLGGGAYQYFMKSKTGDTLAKTDYGGLYLAKYTKKGTLRWRCYTKYPDYNCPTCYYHQKPAIHGLATTTDGSIIMAGNEESDSWLYLNGGDSVQIASPSPSSSSVFNGFVAKMSPAGTLQWRGTVIGGDVMQMKQDKFGNIWLLCDRGNSVTYIKDGTPGSTIFTASTPTTDVQAILIKLSPAGDYLASTIIEHFGTTVRAHVNDLVIDKDGNPWMAGDFMTSANFHNSNGTVAASATRPATTLLRSFYIVKYSAACNYLLHMNGGVISTGRDSYNTSLADRIAVDSLNNIYVMGSAPQFMRDTIHFTHSNGTLNKFPSGGLFLVKLNSAGDFQWANGSLYCDYYSFSHSFHITNDRVFITASIYNNGASWSGPLTSTDGANLNMSMSSAAFLIGEYDYAGKLYRAVQSGTPEGGYLLPYTMFRENNKVYIAGETSRYNGGGISYQFFNQVLPADGASDGFFAVLNNDYCYANVPAVANAGNDRTICAGSPTTIGTAAINESSYLWTSQPAGFTSSLANPTVSPVTTTSYYLTVTNVSGFVARDTVVVTTSGTTANAGADKTICIGSSTTIGVAVTGDTYAWTSSPAGFTSSAANPIVNPSVTTIYFLEVTNGSCISKDTVKVMVNTAVANAGNDRTICKGSATMIGATPPPGVVTYAWTSNPAGFVSNAPQVFVTPLVNTTYYLQMTIGECVTKDTVVVTLGDPVANAGADKVICSGSSTTIGQTGAGVTYSWTSNPAGFSSVLAEPAVSPAVTTTYYLVVSNALSCIARDTVIVTVTPVPPQPVITQSGAVLQSSAAAGNQWFLNGNPIAGATGVNYTPATGGSYTVQVTVNNCVSVMSDVFPYTVTAVDPDPLLNSQITIGPNPVTGILTIRYSGNSALFRVTLATVSGHIVLNETFNRTHQIDMRKYSAAVYIVQVVDMKTNKAARRVIVKQ